MEPFLQLQGIRHQHHGRLVLDIPELQIAKGSITGLTGPNGSGKSTLLRIMALAEQCTSGTVQVEGAQAQSYAGSSGRSIIMLPQEAYLLRRTVFDNIAYGLRLKKRSGNVHAAVEEGLALVGLDLTFAARRWHELSGGEAQRVALAARLVLHPACLLLDEPTASVDMDSATRIRQAVLAARRDRGTTLVIASHQHSWLDDICDELICLYNGRIIEGGVENILLGPWEALGGDKFGRQLADGQWIHATAPPHRESSAMISPEHLVLAPFENVEDHQVLHGTVTGVFLERHAPGPRVHILCGDQRFIASVVKDIFRMDSCRPGTQVILRYRSEDITWLPD
jgi:tungstate transport system ATP-binding protein